MSHNPYNIIISESLILEAEEYARKHNTKGRIAFNDLGEPVLMKNNKPAMDIAIIDTNGCIDIKRKITIIPKSSGVKIDAGKWFIDSVLP